MKALFHRRKNIFDFSTCLIKLDKYLETAVDAEIPHNYDTSSPDNDRFEYIDAELGDVLSSSLRKGD
jgi:hypothetical protein